MASPILKYSYPLTGWLFLVISRWFTVSPHMLFLSGLSWDCAADADGYGTICCKPGYRESLVSDKWCTILQHKVHGSIREGWCRCKSDTTRSEEPCGIESGMCVHSDNFYACAEFKTHGKEATCCTNMPEDKKRAGFCSRACLWSFPSDGWRLWFHYGSTGGFYGMRNSEKSHAQLLADTDARTGMEAEVIYYIYSVKLKQWADIKWSWANHIAPIYKSIEVKSPKRPLISKIRSCSTHHLFTLYCFYLRRQVGCDVSGIRSSKRTLSLM